ncbi:MAG: 8-oxo-dGTP diphosphatase [Lachnospiraceae bacterium]|nr:8-oxo-dGTP diphosphatase [Lachnospiraceae bacterium]
MKIMNSTLCYLERDGKFLMLHRNKKKDDINHDKWIGVGGKLEFSESPEDCLYREVLEETGYALTDHSFRGIVTFVYGEITEYMYLYVSDSFTGEQKTCDEGELKWVDKEDVMNLNIWDGDRIFLKLIADEVPFFSLKLVYDKDDNLVEKILNINRTSPIREDKTDMSS